MTQMTVGVILFVIFALFYIVVIIWLYRYAYSERVMHGDIAAQFRMQKEYRKKAMDDFSDELAEYANTTVASKMMRQALESIQENPNAKESVRVLAQETLDKISDSQDPESPLNRVKSALIEIDSHPSVSHEIRKVCHGALKALEDAKDQAVQSR